MLQVVTDLALVSLVVHFTGGLDSSLNFLYPLVIIVACILLPRVWAYLTSALAFILYGTVLELNYFDVIPSYCHHPSRTESAASHHVRQSVRLPGGGLPGGLAGGETAPGRCQLKDASGALESLQALHENIIQSISGGLITTGLDGQITLVNTAAAEACWAAGRRTDRQIGQALFLDPLPQLGSERAHGEVRFQPANGFAKPSASLSPPSPFPGGACWVTFTPSMI